MHKPWKHLKKNFASQCWKIIHEKQKQYAAINLYCQDESRFGLFTRTGKGLTSRGVKPVCPFQQVFQFTYLMGAYSPFTGAHFELELPACNSSTFQIYLNEFSRFNPSEFKIVLLDNGAFHKAKRLSMPQNIALLFLPPYSPELNPAEKIWQHIKRNFTGKLFTNLSALSKFIEHEVKGMTEEMVKSTCAYSYFFKCSYWTNIY